MLIQYKKGNILDSLEDAIGHCANCQQVMGSGVAKALRDKWPEVFWVDRNDKRYPKERLGSFTKTFLNKGYRVCYNIYGQLDFRGRNIGIMDLSYEALENGLRAVHSDMVNNSLFSIALPMIGAGLAGGDWKKIEEIINKVFGESSIKVVIYQL